MIPPSSQNDIFEWKYEKNKKNILNHDDGSLETKWKIVIILALLNVYCKWIYIVYLSRSPFMFLQILFVGKLLQNVYAVDFWLYIPYSSCVIKASSNRKERFYYRIYLFSEMLRSLENILITLKAGSLALHLY